ncbi:transcriptional regulator [Parafrankia soli]|uniref:Transcriptional regulator n=1 Tax=Parafrankia soli TaxID=2599596 RepID=A0A1S1Q0I5_9ACTN|nr:TetR family transcriptional regulator [Parafrankia soli]OHV27087.1 transcriptional regulator [Parafrankia soli]
MNGATRTAARDVARKAVRAMLAEVALDLFRRDGFDNVTINDIAAAAGVSRSTVLRYFGTKEDAVLGALDAHGEQVADALRARPPDEDDWTALRHALDIVVEIYRQDPEAALATTRLVLATPALHTRQWEKQHGWRPALTQALAERGASRRPGIITHTVRAAAALDCLNIAIAHWAKSDNKLNLSDLLDEAFAALTS